jgi:NACHT domain
MRQYCRVQLGKDSNRILKVSGQAGIALETDSIFVPLRLDAGGAHSKSSSDYALRRASRVAIIGDPGSGKSSLVKKVFRDACRACLGATASRDKDSRPPRLPIRVDLKDFTPPANLRSMERLGEWAFSYLRKQVGSVKGYEMEVLFESYVAGHGVMVLLDGLDEVASGRYPATRDAIINLSRALSDRSENNSVLLTMREQFHEQVRLDFQDDFPTVVRVERFTPADIYEFLTRWPIEPATRDAQIDRIYADLTDHPTLREMCRNPLVLSMDVASDQRSLEVSAPDTRTTFYNQVVDELLVARRSRQIGQAAKMTLREQRESILGQLAFANLIDAGQDANSLSVEHALELVTATYRCPSREVAIERLDELRRDTELSPKSVRARRSGSFTAPSASSLPRSTLLLGDATVGETCWRSIVSSSGRTHLTSGPASPRPYRSRLLFCHRRFDKKHSKPWLMSANNRYWAAASSKRRPIPLVCGPGTSTRSVGGPPMPGTRRGSSGFICSAW